MWNVHLQCQSMAPKRCFLKLSIINKKIRLSGMMYLHINFNSLSVFISNLPVIFLWIGHLAFLLLLCFVMWTSILLCGKILQWLDNLLYLKWKSWFYEKQLLRTYNWSADPLVVSWGTSWSSVSQGIGWCFAGIKSELLHPEHHLALLILIHWTPLIMSCFWINKW